MSLIPLPVQRVPIHGLSRAGLIPVTLYAPVAPPDIQIVATEDGTRYYEGGGFMLWIRNQSGEAVVLSLCYGDQRRSLNYAIPAASGDYLIGPTGLALDSGDAVRPQSKMRPINFDDLSVYDDLIHVLYPALRVLVYGDPMGGEPLSAPLAGLTYALFDPGAAVSGR